MIQCTNLQAVVLTLDPVQFVNYKTCEDTRKPVMKRIGNDEGLDSLNKITDIGVTSGQRSALLRKERSGGKG